jgi:TonB family protein
MRRTTAKVLRADPKFIRTESVLGHTAYVLKEQLLDYVMETYYAPELGTIPLKRITTFSSGRTRIAEPTSIMMGEPDVAQVRGADYPPADQKWIFDRKLSNRIQSKPTPPYPAAARALRLSGTVAIQVIVDEWGQVVRASVVSLPLPLLDEAALDSAYQARFAPLEADGKPIRTSGLITYDFVLPQGAAN